MQTQSDWAPGPGVRVLDAERDGGRWVISAVGPEIGSCPGCREKSTRRHSRYFRYLQDLPVQGAVVTVELRMSRWRCLNGNCERRTFADQPPGIVSPHARRTWRTAELVRLFGLVAGEAPRPATAARTRQAPTREKRAVIADEAKVNSTAKSGRTSAKRTAPRPKRGRNAAAEMAGPHFFNEDASERQA